MTIAATSRAARPRRGRSPRATAAIVCYGAAAIASFGFAALGAERTFALDRELFWTRASGWGALSALLLALVASPVGRVIARVTARAGARGPASSPPRGAFGDDPGPSRAETAGETTDVPRSATAPPGLAVAAQRHVPAFRRAFGITAAALATLHAAIAILTYLGGTLAPIVEHAWLRGGALALAILLALWLTSYPRVVSALRVKLWKPLHRLAFVAALLALQHTLLSPLAPRAWVLAVFGAALAVGLLRFLPRRRQPGSSIQRES